MKARGFTLVEVLVALAVIAVALGAILSGTARYAGEAADLRDRTLALWVAHNRLTEIELEPVWPKTGRSDGDAEMGGDDWRWFVEVQNTPDPDLRRIDIRVQRKGVDYNMATLSSFISSAGRETGP